ncbi:beta-ketoacyl synthase chain length factor [Kitasatospora sp. NPDC004272]
MTAPTSVPVPATDPPTAPPVAAPAVASAVTPTAGPAVTPTAPPAAPPTAPPVVAPRVLGGPLRVLASARWPERPGDELPAIAGFVESSFSPLVAETAERCLRARYGPPPAAGAPRTALLLVSPSGDTGTADALARATADGRRVAPLLFFQSNPNAVLGHVAARWQLDGPVVALGPGFDGEREPHDRAALLIEDGDADQVLVVTAVQGPPDHATAVLLAP